MWKYVGWGLLVAFVGVLLVMWTYSSSIDLEATQQTVIRDRHGQLIYGRKWQGYDSIEQLPQELVEKILMIEDRRFYRHMWVDFRAVARALWANIRAWQIRQGASTIDQQLIKLFSSAYERGWGQKIVEMTTAIRLNLSFDKEQILLAYLNQLPFPYGYRGVRAGCQLLYASWCDQLSTTQQFFLIATYQLWLNPYDREEFLLIQQRSQLLCSQFFVHRICMDWPPHGLADLTPVLESALYHVRRYYLSGWGLPLWEIGDMRTTFDLDLYKRIEKVISTSSSHRATIWAADCCVVVVDKVGNLMSMNVCRAWEDPREWYVNGCLSQRQVGSAMKPFLYIYAMKELGLTPESMIIDEETRFVWAGGTVYTPRNFDLTYHGEVSLASALGSSLNVPAVKLLDQAGADWYIWFLSDLRTAVGDSADDISRDAHRFSATHQWLSLALGTYEMSPLEFAQLWQIFAIWTTSTQASFVHWYQQQITQVREILSTDRRRVYSFVPGGPLDLPGWAVKTGTSRHFVDGWTCGIHVSDGRIICVWMGNYNGQPMKTTGIATAGYLWRLVAELVSK